MTPLPDPPPVDEQDHGTPFVSMACTHGAHGYCQSSEREDGSPKPAAQCEFCGADCVCPCHGSGR